MIDLSFSAPSCAFSPPELTFDYRNVRSIAGWHSSCGSASCRRKRATRTSRGKSSRSPNRKTPPCRRNLPIRIFSCCPFVLTLFLVLKADKDNLKQTEHDFSYFSAFRPKNPAYFAIIRNITCKRGQPDDLIPHN